MKTTGIRLPRHRAGFVAAGLSLVLGLSAAGSAQAATCKDELDRFERRLHSSSLAATDPDTFRALARQAEETALLRDEQQCLETVAGLNEAVPEDADAGITTPGTTGVNDEASSDEKSRPAAPVLLMAGSNDANESDDPQKPAASGESDEKQLDE